MSSGAIRCTPAPMSPRPPTSTASLTRSGRSPAGSWSSSSSRARRNDLPHISPADCVSGLWRRVGRFGVHTFRLVNAEGRSTFVKFCWKPKLGLQSVVWNEALKISGADPDFHRRDLWDAITAGDFPEWELGLQLFDDDFADPFAFDVLDSTKIIPEEEVPVRRVGRLVLDKVVGNFFAETEQVAFCTQNVVPGLDFTNDPLLQGRNFSYLDTQLKR